MYPKHNQIWVKGKKTKVLIISVRLKCDSVFVRYEYIYPTHGHFGTHGQYIGNFKHEFKYSKEKSLEHKAKILREKRKRKKDIESLDVGKLYKHFDNQTIVQILKLSDNHIGFINIESRKYAHTSKSTFVNYYRPILRKSKKIKNFLDEEMIRDIIE
jgi:hypothetical protein